MRRSRWWAGWVALWLAASLFIWMFLASDGLDRAAGDDSGLDPEARRRAAEFADNWRHGLVGSPLFVPGFIVTAAADGVPQTLVDQLGEGGVMVVPVGAERAEQVLLRLTRRPDGVYQEVLADVRFVPLVGGALPEEEGRAPRAAQNGR